MAYNQLKKQNSQVSQYQRNNASANDTHDLKGKFKMGDYMGAQISYQFS